MLDSTFYHLDCYGFWSTGCTRSVLSSEHLTNAQYIQLLIGWDAWGCFIQGVTRRGWGTHTLEGVTLLLRAEYEDDNEEDQNYVPGFDDQTMVMMMMMMMMAMMTKG